MKIAKDCKDITDIRESIDLIDNQIVELITQRAEYVKEAAKFKKNKNAVKDSSRVQQVIESKKKLALEHGVSPELIEKVYTIMIDHFIQEEMEEWQSNL